MAEISFLPQETCVPWYEWGSSSRGLMGVSGIHLRGER